EKRRHALLDACGTQDARIAKLHEHRALRMTCEAALDDHATQIFRTPPARPAVRAHCCVGGILRSAALISAIAFSMSSSDMRRKSGSVAVKSCTSVGRSSTGTVGGSSGKRTSSSSHAMANTLTLSHCG